MVDYSRFLSSDGQTTGLTRAPAVGQLTQALLLALEEDVRGAVLLLPFLLDGELEQGLGGVPAGGAGGLGLDHGPASEAGGVGGGGRGEGTQEGEDEGGGKDLGSGEDVQ